MDIASYYKFVDEQIVTTGLDNATLIEKVGHGVTVPVEVNYLLGKKRSHLELGVGMSNGLYRVHVKTAAIMTPYVGFGWAF